MPKLGPKDRKTRKYVERFCEYVFWLKQVHDTSEYLMQDNVTQSILQQTAHTFFYDLNYILEQYFLLEAAKLCDPARSADGKFENFTVDNLIESAAWSNKCIKKISRPRITVLSFGKHIKTARNKFIAHFDKGTVLSGKNIRKFPKGKRQVFLTALEKICNVFHKEAFGKVYGEMIPNHRGDVLDLIMALKKAIVFDKLISENKGDDSERLNRLLLEFDQSLNLRHKGNVDS
jgi:hypothetical protein